MLRAASTNENQGGEGQGGEGAPRQCRGATNALKQLDALAKVAGLMEEAARHMLKEPDTAKHSTVFTQNVGLECRRATCG